MENFLDKIITGKREEMASAKTRLPQRELINRAKNTPERKGFSRSLTAGPAPRIIAEIKRKSPSKGDISPTLDAANVACIYESNGAAAISVLTDTPHFGGSLEDLATVRKAVSLPLLRKDFIIDPYQVWEARLHGADAVLLIVAALLDGKLKECMAAANEAELDALVEVHKEEEMNMALQAKAKLIGINSRDLRTFTVDTELAVRLRPEIPGDITVVVESGIKNRKDIEKYMKIGYRAFLIGEALTSAPDIGAALRKMCVMNDEL